jgi:hypothetical protein
VVRAGERAVLVLVEDRRGAGERVPGVRARIEVRVRGESAVRDQARVRTIAVSGVARIVAKRHRSMIE